MPSEHRADRFSWGRRCYCRETTLVLVALLALLGILAADPIVQSDAYHAFADTRTLLGMPNFVNIVSNAPFLVFGLAGLTLLRHRRAGATASWAVFFAGVALVGLGSSYYHAAPSDARLIWDRLPITLAFIGLFVALVAEHVNPALERYLLAPGIVLGVASIGWWRYADDLRPYIWVQGMPLLAIPLVLALFPARFTSRSYLLYGLGFYLLAKGAEYYDAALWVGTGGTISGHSIKHLLAALSALCPYFMLARRTPVAPLPAGGTPASPSSARAARAHSPGGT